MSRLAVLVIIYVIIYREMLFFSMIEHVRVATKSEYFHVRDHETLSDRCVHTFLLYFGSYAVSLPRPSLWLLVYPVYIV